MHVLTAALPSRARLPLGVALVLAITAADWLVYDASIGLGFALFLCSLPVLAGFVAGTGPKRGRLTVAAIGQLGAILPLLMQSNALTVGIACAGTLAVCLGLHGRLGRGHSDALTEAFVQAMFAPLRVFSATASAGRELMASSPRANGLVWVGPVALSAGFVFLFAEANPIISNALDAIDLGAFLGHVFGERLWFWFGMAALAAPFLHPAVRQAHRLRMLVSLFAMSRRTGGKTTGWEVGFAIRCLALFNAVFALQTGTDLLYLHAGAALPDGMSYAEYAHRGAYPLVATASLAAMFVVWTTRPQGPAAASPLVTKLVLAWVAQNVLLLASSLMRLDLYVGAMGLTYWRVAAAIWMGLTGLGFLLIVIRGLRGHSLGWLVSANVTALLAAFYVAGCVNWADVIARSQLARFDRGSTSALYYVRGIGAAALPAVLDYVEDAERRTVLSDRRTLERTMGRVRQAAIRQDHGWRAATLRRRRLGMAAAKPYTMARPTAVEAYR